jgi:hypothetical protein
VTVWTAVLGASFVAYALKLAGYLVPSGWLTRPRIARVSGLLPAALLAALVVVQTFTSGAHLVVDARAAGLCAAVVALLLRAPFIVVVIVAAAAAALVRAAGWG